MANSLPSDYEIAQSVDRQHIADVVSPFGIDRDNLELYGDDVAKLSLDAIDQSPDSQRLILVTGMTPTPLGEGKTVTTVGLSQALNVRDHPAVATIREPSLGPVFGVKGGAAGGGYAQVLPMENINLHFTGDIHALTAAHNLIAAMLDARISKDNDLQIDPSRVSWKRAIDMNDRALRETVIGLGGENNGTTREDGFLLTAASELMAILALAEDFQDLKRRIGSVIVGYDTDEQPVTVDDIDATGAVSMLLRDAIKPNVVQTTEGTPALIHAGPFANIAHGTNSLIADRAAFNMADWVVTEAGFGSDLGAEKFFDVVCRTGDIAPAAAVIVASCRALKYHGKDMWPAAPDELKQEDIAALKAGFDNLDRHVQNLRQFGVPVVVAVNRFPFDTEQEIETVLDHCRTELSVPAAVSTVYADGGPGGVDLADMVLEAADSDPEVEYLYELDASIEDKIETIATDIYGAENVEYSDSAKQDIRRMEDLGYAELPIVMSKTFHSLTDDPSRKGAPTGWTLNVEELYPSAGAGFLVALTDDVMTLPGLPAHPAAVDMDVDGDGNISGLF